MTEGRAQDNSGGLRGNGFSRRLRDISSAKIQRPAVGFEPARCRRVRAFPACVMQSGRRGICGQKSGDAMKVFDNIESSN